MRSGARPTISPLSALRNHSSAARSSSIVARTSTLASITALFTAFANQIFRPRGIGREIDPVGDLGEPIRDRRSRRSRRSKLENLQSFGIQRTAVLLGEPLQRVVDVFRDIPNVKRRHATHASTVQESV